MPTCYECLGTLPHKCICPIPNSEKLKRWLEAANREIELIRKIMTEDFKPKVEAYIYKEDEQLSVDVYEALRVKCKKVSVKVEKIDEFAYKIVINLTAPVSGHAIEAILYDAEGKPLFRRILMGRILSGDKIELYWNLQVG